MSEVEHGPPPRRNVWTDLYDQDIERLTDERDEARRQLAGAVEALERIIADARHPDMGLTINGAVAIAENALKAIRAGHV